MGHPEVSCLSMWEPIELDRAKPERSELDHAKLKQVLHGIYVMWNLPYCGILCSIEYIRTFITHTLSYIHTYIREYIHIHIQTCMHTYQHIHTGTFIIHTHTCTYIIHTCMHNYMHAYKHTYVYTYMCVHMHARIHIHACMQAYIHKYEHTYAHIYIHTSHTPCNRFSLQQPSLSFSLFSVSGMRVDSATAQIDSNVLYPTIP